VQNTVNSLTITLRVNLRLEPGSTVTLSGLVGTTTPDGAVALVGADAGLFADTGSLVTLDAEAGAVVTLTVAHGQVRTRDSGFRGLHHWSDWLVRRGVMQGYFERGGDCGFKFWGWGLYSRV
jgi:hypothetical protein